MGWDSVAKYAIGIIGGLMLALADQWIAGVAYRQLVERNYLTRQEFESRLDREAPYVYDKDNIELRLTLLEQFKRAAAAKLGIDLVGPVTESPPRKGG